MGKSVKLWY